MRCFKLVSVLVLFFSIQVFSQEDSDTFSVTDSINQSKQNLKSELQFKNFFKSDFKKNFDENLLMGLNLYSKVLTDSTFTIQSYKLNLNEYSDEELADFRESFQMLMEYAKNDRNKYDLGVVGKYLGISRNIMAIILAILSAAK